MKGIAVRVSLFRRGKTWWVRFNRAGKKVRQSLKTENRKVTETCQRSHFPTPASTYRSTRAFWPVPVRLNETSSPLTEASGSG